MFGELRVTVKDLRSIFTVAMSALNTTPRPSAPLAQCKALPPAKCPPQRISVMPGSQVVSRAIPKSEVRMGPRDPLAVSRVEKDRHVEGPRPLLHGRVEVRVRNGDGF